jgi:hypothetical protein
MAGTEGTIMEGPYFARLTWTNALIAIAGTAVLVAVGLTAGSMYVIILLAAWSGFIPLMSRARTKVGDKASQPPTRSPNGS